MIPPLFGSWMNERILVPNMPLSTARASRASSFVIGFISCTPYLGVGKPLIDLHERDDVFLLPQKRGGVLAVDGAIHRLLEKDGGQDLLAGEARAQDQSRAHLVDEVEHLLVVAVRVLGNAVELQAPWACCRRFGPARR